MCRLLGWASGTERSLADVLGPAALDGFTALSRHHADGWGLATARTGGGSEVERSTAGAAGDPAFARAVRRAAPAGVAHLRWATPGMAVETRNTHPFRRGDTAFAHNGALHPQDRLARALPLRAPYAPEGTTDSERYFLTLLAALDAGADVAAAVSTVVERIGAAGLEASSLNALLLTPTTLAAVNVHDPARAPLHPHVDPGAGADAAAARDAPYFDLRYRADADAVVVASSGFDQPAGEGWTALPNSSVLLVDRATLRTEVVALASGLAPAAR